MKRLSSLAVTVVFILAMTGAVSAVPRLQTYIVGSNYYDMYHQESDSWITNNNNFDVKVVGYWQPAGTAGGSSSLLGGRPSGANRDFMDCYLMVSIPRQEAGTIWINGEEMTGFGSYWSTVPAGLHPNPSLRNHMPAGIGRFNFASIGRIDNSRINAYDYSCGSIGNPGWGDEILLNVVTSGYSWVHFDAAGVDSRGRTYTNPYSHDASYYGNEVPEPGTLSLLGLGLLGMIPILRRKRD